MDLLQPIRLLGGLFYPNVCANCGNWLTHGEESICLHCIDALPRTGFLLHKQNPAEKIFWGRAKIKFASSYLYFAENGMVQKLMHQVKYKGNKDLAKNLGKYFAADLLSMNPSFKPDILIPVPLHPRKQKQRGYNQSYHFALGLAEILGCQVNTELLFRNIYGSSQTKKSRINRWENVEEAFTAVPSDPWLGKSIVLVDDVITTGATAEACLKALSNMGFTDLAYLSLAIATG